MVNNNKHVKEDGDSYDFTLDGESLMSFRAEEL